MKSTLHPLFFGLALLAGIQLVGAQPVITTAPTNQIVLANSTNTVFSVGVSGPGPLSYQWLFDGTNLPNGIITTVAGAKAGPARGDNGAATNAQMLSPAGMAVDAFGNYFIADTGNNRIRKVNTNGIITTVAGNGTQGFSGDGNQATNAELHSPIGVAVDAYGNIFIADIVVNGRIRKVNTNGIIVTIAGNGVIGYSGDGGQATNAEFKATSANAFGMTLDASGNLYITDTSNNRIRKVDTNDVITTVAGNGSFEYNGDGEAATNASLWTPDGVAVDAAGDIFIADFGNNRIRKVDTNNIITTFAGTGSAAGGAGLGDGGAATNGDLTPCGINFDIAGNLFIGDLANRGVRRVDTNNIITTVAGKGVVGYSGDGGMATNATLGCPYAVGFDPGGNLLILDELNSVVRKIWFAGLPSLPLNTLYPNTAGFYQVVVTGSSGSVTSSVANLSIAYPSLTAFATTNNGSHFVIQWPVFQPSVFQVQWTTNLANGSWSNLGGPVIYSGTTTGIIGQGDYSWMNNVQAFYRIAWLQ
jgi:sugar lactone lactonase YvrE